MYDVESTPCGFSTKYADPETGLVYYGYRYYSPVLGRWLNRDPMEEHDFINLYAFVGNNPLTFFDAFGLSSNNSSGTVVVQGVGAGWLGQTITLNGKTAVQLGGQDFYITGTPQPGMHVPPSGTTSSLFIYKQSDPSKLYRLDYHALNSSGGQAVWHHNQKGVAQVDGLSVTNHSVTPSATVTGRTLTIFRWGGRAAFVVGAAMSAYDIYNAQNKPRTIVQQVGGWTGSIALGTIGAKGGTAAGAAVGAWFAGAGAAPGAVIGGIVGGVGGGVAGWTIGSNVAVTVYDWFFEPLDKEEWVIQCP